MPNPCECLSAAATRVHDMTICTFPKSACSRSRIDCSQPTGLFQTSFMIQPLAKLRIVFGLWDVCVDEGRDASNPSWWRTLFERWFGDDRGDAMIFLTLKTSTRSRRLSESLNRPLLFSRPTPYVGPVFFASLGFVELRFARKAEACFAHFAGGDVGSLSYLAKKGPVCRFRWPA